MAEDTKVGEGAPAPSVAPDDERGGEPAGQHDGGPASTGQGAASETEHQPESQAVAMPEPQPGAESADEATSAAVAVEKAAMVGAPSQSPAAGAPGRRIYQASTVRKTLLSFVFLILLPFFASLPAMVAQRIMHQLWPNMVGFAIFAIAFAIIILLVLFELIRSIRARVVIGESAVGLTLPAARGIAMPKLFYKSRVIPYSEIETVETRREVYGGAIAPVMLRGARIVTKSGDKVPLGYVSEANVDPVLPVPEIAAEIARRAGLEVVDHGTVRRQFHKKMRGIRATDDGASPLTEADIAALNRRHNKVMLALCGALFLLVAAGLVLDLSKSSLDLGERARQLVQQLVNPSPDVQRAGTQKQ